MKAANRHLINTRFYTRPRLWLAALILVFSQVAVAEHGSDHDITHAADETCQICWHAQHLDSAIIGEVSIQSQTVFDSYIITPPPIFIPRTTQVFFSRAPPHFFS